MQPAQRGTRPLTRSPTARQACVGRGCARVTAAAAAAAARGLAQAPRGGRRHQRPRARAVLRTPLALAGHPRRPGRHSAARPSAPAAARQHSAGAARAHILVRCLPVGSNFSLERATCGGDTSKQIGIIHIPANSCSPALAVKVVCFAPQAALSSCKMLAGPAMVDSHSLMCTAGQTQWRWMRWAARQW